MNQDLTFDNIDPKTRRLSMIGLTLGMLIACLDGTIIATCGATIAADLKDMGLYSWMLTAYLLCETSMIPIAGKLSDRYGRKPLFVLGLLIFIISSIFAGMSSNMEMMVACRGFQGLGGGMLVPVAMASVADFYSPKERGKVQGILGAVFGIGSGLGPLIGGAICSFVSWNWVFYINVPLAAVCLALTIKKFPMVAEPNDKRIDYLGMAILTALILDILLYFEWISGEMRFEEPRSIFMILGGIVLAVAFVLRERRAEDPVFSPRLVRNRIVVFSAVYLFLFGICMFGMMIYVSLYITTVYDYDALQCGITLLPMVFGAMITSMVSGMSAYKTGFRVWLVTGAIMISAALFLMSTMGASRDLPILCLYLFIFGFGMGCSTATVMIAVQSVTPKSEMGMTTSAVSLMRNIGSTVGTAMFAMIITGSMNDRFADTIFAPLAEMFDLSGIGLLALRYIEVPGFEGVGDAVVQIFSDSTCWAFFNGACLFLIALILAFLIETKKHHDSDEVEKDREEDRLHGA